MEGKNHFRTVWTQTPLFSGGNIVSVALPTRPLNTLTKKNAKVKCATATTTAIIDSKKEQPQLKESSSSEEEYATMEALVMVCGDVVNLVAASTGDLLCSYKLPVEDVILHIDAVSHIRRKINVIQVKKETHKDEKKLFSKEKEEEDNKAIAISQSAEVEKSTTDDDKTNETERKKRSRKRKRNASLAQNVNKNVDHDVDKANQDNNTIKNKMEANALWDNNPEDVPLGVYVAVATRSLQIYLLRVDTINNYVGEEEEDSGGNAHSHDKSNEQVMKNVNDNNIDEDNVYVKSNAELMRSNISFGFHLLRNWTAAQQAISMVYFTPLSSLLVSASTDGNVKVWNPFHHYLTHNLHNTHATVITSVVCDATETLLAVGDVEGHVTLFDFINKRVRASARPHVQAIVGLHITKFENNSSFSNGGKGKKQSGVYVYSVSQDRKLAMLHLTSNSNINSNTNALREVRSIVLREQVTACCFEDEFTLHVGALNGGVLTYSLHPTEAVQLTCQLPIASHNVENEQDTESSVRSLIVSHQYKGNLTHMAGFIVDAPETLCKYNSRSLYVADAGFNIACLRKQRQVQVSTNNINNDSSKKVNAEVSKPVYHVAYTLVGYLGQILDLKMLSSVTKPNNYDKDTEHEGKGKKESVKEAKTKEGSTKHEEEEQEIPSLASMQRLIVTNSKDVRLFPSTGCRSTHCLQGHSDIVMCCAVTEDGTLIATAGKDTTIRFWSRFPSSNAYYHHHNNNDKSTTELNEENEEVKWQWYCVAVGTGGHSNDINALSFNHKASNTFCVLFSVGNDENLRLWDVDQQVMPWTYAYNQCKANIITKTKKDEDEEDISLCSVQSVHIPSVPHTFSHRAGINSAHNGPIYTVAISPNDQYVATGGKDKAVHLWNINGKKIYREGVLVGHKRGVSSLAFSSHDRVLASASHDGSIRLWSLTSLSCVKTLQVDKTAILQMAFFNHGTQLVCGNAEGVMRVWAIATSQEVWSAAVHEDKIWALQVIELETSNNSTINTTMKNESDEESANHKENEKRGAVVVDTFILTGSADGVLNCTEDYTAEAVADAQASRAEMVQQEQALQNALRSNGFVQAFQLALKLRHPRHLRQVLMKWCANDTMQCTHALRKELLPELDQDELIQLLQFTREWLTNSRYCHIASVVIHAVVSLYSLMEMTHMPHLHGLIAPLLAYSQKHSQRQHELLRQTYYIDYLARALSPTTLSTLPPFVTFDRNNNTETNTERSISNKETTSSL